MPVRSFALRAKRLGRRVALVAGGAAVLVSSTVPTAAQGVLSTQPIAAPPQPQTYLTLTLSTAVTSALVIFVAAFLLGFWCGWMWRRQRGTRL
jgi:heme/copper-type cytochrome/quinol oxidase subunit 2